MKEAEPKRLLLYRLVSSLLRACANLANEMEEAGYSEQAAQAIKAEVKHFEDVRAAVKLKSGDYIDLKMYEPAMRHLIDAYIRAEDSTKLSAFDDLWLVDMIVKSGVSAIDALPETIAKDEEAAAETIENNDRKIITDEEPVNPAYYQKMSDLLDALVKRRREGALEYKAYLDEIVELARKVKNPVPAHPTLRASTRLRIRLSSITSTMPRLPSRSIRKSAVSVPMDGKITRLKKGSSARQSLRCLGTTPGLTKSSSL